MANTPQKEEDDLLAFGTNPDQYAVLSGWISVDLARDFLWFCSITSA